MARAPLGRGRILILWLLLSALLAITACSSKPEILEADAAPTTAAPKDAVTQTSGQRSASATVDETGFTLTMGDITAHAPGGVAPVGTRVHLKQVPLPADAVQAGLTAAGGAFDISFDGGAQPAVPVRIQVALDQAPEPDAPLGFITQHSESGQWEGLPVSIDGTTASVQLDHFSVGVFGWFDDLVDDFSDQVQQFMGLRHDPPDCHGKTLESGGRVFTATTDNNAVYVCVEQHDGGGLGGDGHERGQAGGVLLTVHSNSPYVWEVRPDTATARGLWAGSHTPLSAAQIVTVAFFNLQHNYTYDEATVLVPGGRAPILLHQDATSTTAVARVDAGLGLIAVTSAGLGMLTNVGVVIPYEQLVSIGECAAELIVTATDMEAVAVVRTILGCVGTVVTGAAGILVAGLVSLAPLLATQITGFIGEFTGANTAHISVTSEPVGQLPSAPDADLTGTWFGDVDQVGARPYSVRVDFTREGEGYAAEVTYPELSCSGTWTQTASSGESFTFLEVISEGAHNCIIEVVITIAPQPDGTLAYSFDFPSGTATLQREARSGGDYRLFQGVDGWDEAVAHCAAQDGYLALIDSAEEDEHVFSWLREQGANSAYFGFFRNDADEWKWVSPTESTYANWAPGEPNNERGRERYAMYYWQFPEGTWNDGDFGHGTNADPVNFICEFDDEAVAEAAVAP